MPIVLSIPFRLETNVGKGRREKLWQLRLHGILVVDVGCEPPVVGVGDDSHAYDGLLSTRGGNRSGDADATNPKRPEGTEKDRQRTGENRTDRHEEKEGRRKSRRIDTRAFYGPSFLGETWDGNGAARRSRLSHGYALASSLPRSRPKVKISAMALPPRRFVP